MKKKLLLKTAVYISIFFIVTGVTAAIYFYSGPGENLLKSKLEQAISAAAGQTAKIKEVNFIFPSSVKIKGVALSSGSVSTTAALTIDKVEASFKLTPLLSRRISLRYLKLNGFSVRLNRDKEGKLYLPFAKKETVPTQNDPLKFKVNMGDISITNSSLSIEGEKTAVGLHFEGMAATISDRNDTLLLKVNIATGEIKYGEDVYPVDFVKLKGELKEDSISLSEFKTSIAGLSLSAVADRTKDGKLSGQIRYSGDLLKPAESLKLLKPRGRLEGNGIIDFTILKQGGVKISRFTFSGSDGKLEVEGSYQSQEVELKAVAKDIEAAKAAVLAGKPDLITEGKANISLLFKGNPKKPADSNVDASIHLKKFAFSGRRVPDSEIDLIYESGQGTASLKSDAFNSDVSFSYDDSNLNADIKLKDVSTKELAKYFDLKGAEGELQLNAAVRNFPSKPRIETEIESNSLKYGKYMFNDINLNAIYKTDKLDISNFKAAVGTAAVLSGSARIDLKKFEGSFNVNADNISSERISSVSGKFTREEGNFIIEAADKKTDLDQVLKIFPGELSKAGGIVSWDGKAIFKENGLSESYISFNWEAPRIKQHSFSKITGQAKYFGEKIDIAEIKIFDKANSATLKDASFFLKKFKDKVSLDRSRPIKGNISVSGLDMAAVNEMFELPFYLKGLSNVSIKVAGTVKDPDITGEVNIQNGTFRRRGSNITANDLSVSLKMENDIIDLKKLSGKIENVQFEFSGRGDRLNKDSWKLDMTGRSGKDGKIIAKGKVSSKNTDMELTLENFQLFLFKPFVSGVSRLEGAVNGKLAVRGRLASPSLKGMIRGESINILTKQLIEPAENISMQIVFTEDKITIVKLNGKFSNGKFDLSGDIGYSPSGPEKIELSAKGTGIGFNMPNMGSVKIDKADLSLSGKDRYLLKGEIDLKELKITADRMISAVKSRSLTRERKPIDIDLKISSKRNVWMDNRLGRVRNSLNINAGGTLSSPVVTGELKAVEGYLYYLDRKFTIKKGVINFTDPVETKPVLDIEAETVVIPSAGENRQKYTVLFYVSGPAASPDIKLISQPSLSKPEIVSLLTFGVTGKYISGDNITGRESEFGEILKERAGALTSRRITGLFTGKVESLLNLGTFAIEGDIFKYGSGSGPRVVASKEITSRTEVTYSTALGDTGERKIRLGYRLNQNFLLESTNENMGSTGIGLKYRLMLK